MEVFPPFQPPIPGRTNEYDNRDRLHTAREALKKRLADLRKKKVQA